MSWLDRLKNHLASEPKIESQAPQRFNIKTISTTQLGEIAGIHLPSQMIKNLGFKPFAQTKSGVFWAFDDVPFILVALSKHFSDKAKEQLNKK